MNLTDTPDDSLRYAAERGQLEHLEHCRARYFAAEKRLADARDMANALRPGWSFFDPPSYYAEAIAERDARWNDWLEAEEINAELSALAEAQEAAEWRAK